MNEQYDGCDAWQALQKAEKPVCNCDYLDRALNAAAPKMDSICGSPDAKGFQTVFKEKDLSDWIEARLVFTTEHTRKCHGRSYAQRIV